MTSVWDTASWTQTGSFKLPSTCASIKNDGNFAICTHNASYYEHVGEDVKEKAAEGGGEQVWAVQLVGDDMYFTTDSGKLGRYNTKKGASVWTIPAHSLLAIGLHVNGAFVATCSKDMTVSVWETATGKAVKSYKGHEGACESVRISSDGKTLVSGGSDGLYFWDTATGALRDRIYTKVFGLDMSRDGKRVAVAGAEGLSVWDTQSMARIAAIGGVAFTAVALSPDGKALATSALPSEYVLRVFDVAALLAHPLDFRAFSAPLVGHAFPVNQIAVAKDGKTILSSRGGVKVWDVATERVVRSIDVGRLAATPDEKTVASVDEGKIVVFDVATGTSKATVPAADVADVDIDAKATRVLAVAPTLVRLLDSKTGHEIAKFAAPAIQVAKLSPDGNSFAVGAGAAIEIVDAKTGKSKATLVGHAENVTSLAWSGNGKVLGSASRHDAKAITWDVAKKKKLATFGGHVQDVTSIDVDATGKLAVTGSSDGTTRIWDAATAKQMKVLRVPHEDAERDLKRGYSADLFDVHFTGDGKRVFTAAANNSVRGYDVSTGAPVVTLSGFFKYYLPGINENDPTLAKPAVPMSANAAKFHLAAMQACTDGKEAEALENIQKVPQALDFPVPDDNGNGWTLTMMCADHNLPNVVKQLLAMGADATLTRKSGEGALESAVRGGYDDIVKMLIAAKVSVTHANKNGETPLFLAAATGHVNAMKMLLDAGAPVDAKGPGGARALHYAAAFGTADAVRLLLDKGADMNKGDDEGASPMSWAHDKENEDTMAVFRKRAG